MERGGLGYFAGVDRSKNAMHNASLWETVEDANQMTSFQPMLDLAGAFIALGVRFQRRSSSSRRCGASIATEARVERRAR